LVHQVVELEGQLRIVTIQRKKAEKAAAEVLAILETQGIGDLSEAIDSSSDGEVPCDDTQKEYESSTASRMERSEVEDGLPGSEPEVSPLKVGAYLGKATAIVQILMISKGQSR